MYLFKYTYVYTHIHIAFLIIKGMRAPLLKCVCLCTCVCLYTYIYMHLPGRKHSKLVVLGGGNEDAYYSLLCYFRFLSISPTDVNVRKWWMPLAM